LFIPQVSSLDGLEPTLIRNLTDHVGNNLLHTICAHGHSSLLPWVTRRFGVELDGALADENRRGLTPASAAIKVTYYVTDLHDMRHFIFYRTALR
jgi:hypothetical protein